MALARRQIRKRLIAECYFRPEQVVSHVVGAITVTTGRQHYSGEEDQLQHGIESAVRDMGYSPLVMARGVTRRVRYYRFTTEEMLVQAGRAGERLRAALNTGSFATTANVVHAVTGEVIDIDLGPDEGLAGLAFTEPLEASER